MAKIVSIIILNIKLVYVDVTTFEQENSEFLPVGSEVTYRIFFGNGKDFTGDVYFGGDGFPDSFSAALDRVKLLWGWDEK